MDVFCLVNLDILQYTNIVEFTHHVFFFFHFVIILFAMLCNNRMIYSSHQLQLPHTFKKQSTFKIFYPNHLLKTITLVSYDMNIITHLMLSSMTKQDMQLKRLRVCIGNIYGSPLYRNLFMYLMIS